MIVNVNIFFALKHIWSLLGQCAFQPEYPGQYENLTVNEIQTIINDDISVITSMLTEAEKRYRTTGLTPVVNFYQFVLKFLSKDGLSGAFMAMDQIGDEKTKILTYAQFAQHWTKCRYEAVIVTKVRNVNPIDVSHKTEQELKANFTKIYNTCLELLKKGREFGEKHHIAFWPFFHQLVRKRQNHIRLNKLIRN